MKSIGNRLISNVGITLDYQTYTLLEYYNHLQEEKCNGIYYDERFVKIMMSSLIGNSNILQYKQFDYDDEYENDNIMKFIKGMF